MEAEKRAHTTVHIFHSRHQSSTLKDNLGHFDAPEKREIHFRAFVTKPRLLASIVASGVVVQHSGVKGHGPPWRDCWREPREN